MRKRIHSDWQCKPWLFGAPNNTLLHLSLEKLPNFDCIFSIIHYMRVMIIPERKFKITVYEVMALNCRTEKKEKTLWILQKNGRKMYRLWRLKIYVVGFIAPSEKIYDCRASTYIISEGKPTFCKEKQKN